VNPLWAKVFAARFQGVACSAIKPETFGDLMKAIEEKVWQEGFWRRLPITMY
jgi:hypothetical protein